MSPDSVSCPHCDADLSDGTYLGHIEPRVYDGVLYWSCPQCGGKWHRWPVGDRLRARAARFVGEP